MNILRRMFVVSLAAIGAFAVPALAADANVAGTWAITVDIQGTSGNPTLVLTQNGATLAGTYKGQLGEAPVTGTVKGNEVTIKFDVEGQGQKMTITYAGTVEGNTMKGKLSLGDMGEGTFTGTKK